MQCRITSSVRFGQRWGSEHKRADTRRRDRDGDGESTREEPRGVLAWANRGAEHRADGRELSDGQADDEVCLRGPQLRSPGLHGPESAPAHVALLADGSPPFTAGAR